MSVKIELGGTAARRVIVAGALVACAAGGMVVGAARAAGIPTSSPLFYSGVLEESGLAVEGARDLVVEIYDVATGGSALCRTDAPDAPVVAGRFRVALEPACVDVLADEADAFVQVTVGSTTLQPRTKIGAVPYAVTSGDRVPPGAVMAFDLDACPAGWSEVQAARGRVVVGTNPGGGGLSIRALGATGGAETATLTVANMPAHDHGVGTLAIPTGGSHEHVIGCRQGADGQHGHDTYFDTAAPGPSTSTAFCGPIPAHAAPHSHPSSEFTGAVASVGGGQAFDAMPPFLALLYCRKDGP